MLTRRGLLQRLSGLFGGLLMTQRSLPWEGTTALGYPGDAGPYSYQDWERLHKGIVAPGAWRPNVGVLFGSDSLDAGRRGLEVTASSPAAASVAVRPGSALVQGTFYHSDAVETLAIAANASGNPRLDTIILRKDTAAQTVRLAVLQGTPAVIPLAAALTQNTATWEIPLAYITAANGFVTITAAEIIQVAEPANGADGTYLYGILNNSGGELRTGDVVVWDMAVDKAVTTTTTANAPTVAGVWVGVTPNGGYGRVMVDGVGLVRVNAAVARGTVLATSTTAKQAKAGGASAFAFTLEATSGAGLVRAALGDGMLRLAQYTMWRAVGAGNPQSAAPTGGFIDVPHADYTINLTTYGRDVEIYASGLIALNTYASTVAVLFDVELDGTRIGNSSDGLERLILINGGAQDFYRVGPIRIPLAAGAHTFKLQWSCGATVTLTASNVTAPSTFRVTEVP